MKTSPDYEEWHAYTDPEDPTTRARCLYDRHTACYLHIDTLDGLLVADLRLWRKGVMIAGSGVDGEWPILSLWLPRYRWPREIEAGSKYRQRRRVPKAIIRALEQARDDRMVTA